MLVNKHLQARLSLWTSLGINIKTSIRSQKEHLLIEGKDTRIRKLLRKHLFAFVFFTTKHFNFYILSLLFFPNTGDVNIIMSLQD